MKIVSAKINIILLAVILPVSLMVLSCEATGDTQDQTVVMSDEAAAEPDESQEGGLQAVEFPANAEWVNTGTPLTMEDLRGRYVLLDFWTYGCINCYHMVPNLNELHARYEGGLVVVGVHSAKFSHESETENIQQAVQRYDIRYPVLNDAEMVLWQAYMVPGWPTILLFDPDGNVVGGHVGEWQLEMITTLMDQLLAGEAAELPPLPRELQIAGSPKLPPTVLRFPEGVYWDQTDELLYISDTGNNRVIAVDVASGEVSAVYGDGVAGFNDGNGLQARFRRPRGIARLGDAVYVADTDNHAIRRIDISDDSVTTVARGDLHTIQGLRSPWGLAADQDVLYIANAGEHQVWTYDPGSGKAELFAGSGIEGVRDGPVESAEFAQPSGLFVSEQTLWVADPESSAVRSIALGRREVTTAVGTGLFDFGDRDGPVEEALLMHAADVAVFDGAAIVLDTYNNKVKRISDGVVTTLPISGLNEPTALTVQGERLWIADTNNHRIVSVSGYGGAVDPLRVSPGISGSRRMLSVQQNLGTSSLELLLTLPRGYKLNEGSPNTVAVWNPDGREYAMRVESTAAETETVRIPWSDLVAAEVIDQGSARQSVQVELWLYYCEREDETVCLFDGATYTVAIEDTPAAEGPATIEHRVGQEL